MKKHYASSLIGKTIRNVSSLTQEEINHLLWSDHVDSTTIIEFTDGTCVIVAQDPELNGAGFLDIIQSNVKEQ